MSKLFCAMLLFKAIYCICWAIIFLTKIFILVVLYIKIFFPVQKYLFQCKYLHSSYKNIYSSMNIYFPTLGNYRSKLGHVPSSLFAWNCWVIHINSLSGNCLQRFNSPVWKTKSKSFLLLADHIQRLQALSFRLVHILWLSCVML